jgi:hypothetical protein
VEKFVPIYTTYDNVKVRLANKVQFQSNTKKLLEGELPDALLGQIISDSETQVEQALRKRYEVPFQSIRTGRYQDLPDHSKRALRVAVDMKCVMNILITDFGRGAHIDSDSYKKNIEDAYDKYILELLGQDAEGKEKKKFRNSPPLLDVKLARGNRAADDGFQGMIINTDGGHRDAVSYAEQQLNDPSRTYITRRGMGPL